MQKHTPGPWEAAPITDSDAVPTSIWAQGGAIWIAEMKDRCLMRGNPNARLIAAAPDLLAAVEEIGRAIWDNLMLLPEEKHGIYPYLLDVAREARDKTRSSS